MPNKVVNKIIKKNKGQKVPFKDLPLEYQLAIAHYMAVDGEAWDIPNGDFPSSFYQMEDDKRAKAVRRFLEENMDWFVKKYGNRKFGKVDIPVADVKAGLEECGKHKDSDWEWASADEWLKWYRGHNDAPATHYNKAWPVVLSDFPEEFLQDGWHRLSVYLGIRKKMKTIPAFYY